MKDGKMKNILILQLLLPISLFCQDLRNEVAIIRATPVSSIKDTYDKMALWLEGMCEEDLSRDIRGRKEGTLGTSFSLICDGIDEKLFITNYHVVAGSDEFSMEWQPLTGETLTIDGCQVAYVDPFRDLAVVCIPEGKAVPGEGFGLVSDKETVDDGMEIWAAGYPGLISSPAWQLSNGIISNQKAVIPELVEEGLPYLLQHTSVIDPGSSGGPLMVKEKGEYKVVGVNSMTATYRNNTFFAVPSDILGDFIMEYRNGAAEASPESLERTLEGFTALFSDEDRKERDMGFYLSDEYSAERGFDIYLDKRGRLSSDERAEWDRALLGRETLGALKSIVGIDLFSIIEGEKLSWEINSYDVNDAEILIKNTSGEEFLMKWGFSRGIWTMHGYPSDYVIDPQKGVMSHPPVEGDRLAYRSGFNFYAGLPYTLGKFEEDNPGIGGYYLGVEMLNVFSKIFALSSVFGWESYQMTGRDSSGAAYQADKGCLEFGLNLNFFPTGLIRKHILTPWLRGGVGFDVCPGDFGNFDDSSSLFYYYWLMGAGVQISPANWDESRLGAMVDFKSVNALAPDQFSDKIGADRIGLTLSYIVQY